MGDVLIEGQIFVQANPVWEPVDEETAWVQDLRGRDARIQGLVAGVPLDRGAAAVNASLQRLSHEPGVAGVRQLIQGLHISYAAWVPSSSTLCRTSARERDRVMRGTALEVYARACESR